MKTLFAFLLFVGVTPAVAQTTPLTVTCSSPSVANSDGTALTDFKQYNVEYSSCNNGVFVTPAIGTAVSTDAARCTTVLSGLPVGVYCVRLSTTRRENNATSGWSNTAISTVSSVPVPPGGVSVTVATVAFVEKTVPWGTQLAVLPIQIPIGTPCTTPVCGWPKQYRYVPSVVSDKGYVVGKCSVPVVAAL